MSAGDRLGSGGRRSDRGDDRLGGSAGRGGVRGGDGNLGLGVDGRSPGVGALATSVLAGSLGRSRLGLLAKLRR
jgi:hypothetical protein